MRHTYVTEPLVSVDALLPIKQSITALRRECLGVGKGPAPGCSDQDAGTGLVGLIGLAGSVGLVRAINFHVCGLSESESQQMP